MHNPISSNQFPAQKLSPEMARKDPRECVCVSVRMCLKGNSSLILSQRTQCSFWDRFGINPEIKYTNQSSLENKTNTAHGKCNYAPVSAWESESEKIALGLEINYFPIHYHCCCICELGMSDTYLVVCNRHLGLNATSWTVWNTSITISLCE